ncbi:MAG: hypothetical protein ACM3ML_23000 [Micromonosporaceae bacterium]
MIERLYFEHPHVSALADSGPHEGGRVLHVVCEDTSAAGYAAHLTARLNVTRPRPAPGDAARPERRAAL